MMQDFCSLGVPCDCWRSGTECVSVTDGWLGANGVREERRWKGGRGHARLLLVGRSLPQIPSGDRASSPQTRSVHGAARPSRRSAHTSLRCQLWSLVTPKLHPVEVGPPAGPHRCVLVGRRGVLCLLSQWASSCSPVRISVLSAPVCTPRRDDESACHRVGHCHWLLFFYRTVCDSPDEAEVDKYATGRGMTAVPSSADDNNGRRSVDCSEAESAASDVRAVQGSPFVVRVVPRPARPSAIPRRNERTAAILIPPYSPMTCSLMAMLCPPSAASALNRRRSFSRVACRIIACNGQ